MKRYYWLFPNDPYALGPSYAKNVKDARRQAREWAGVSRLPKGFKVWIAFNY